MAKAKKLSQKISLPRCMPERRYQKRNKKRPLGYFQEPKNNNKTINGTRKDDKNIVSITFFLYFFLHNRRATMDKKIKRIEKETKKVGTDLKKLETADHKRDKVCDMGKKMMEKKKK